MHFEQWGHWAVTCVLVLAFVTGGSASDASLGTTVTQWLALPLLVDTPLIWIGPLIAGVGGTAMISLPIPYYQDLLAGRPGTAAVQTMTSTLFRCSPSRRCCSARSSSVSWRA